MFLGQKSLRTTGLIKEINQNKRREKTDIRHIINQTIHSVLRDLLQIREYLTGRIAEDLISFLTWVGLEGESGLSTEIFTGIFLSLILCNFFTVHRCCRETSGQEQSHPLIQHSNRYSLAWLIDFRYNFKGHQVLFPYHSNLERLRKTEVFYSQFTGGETKTGFRVLP